LSVNGIGNGSVDRHDPSSEKRSAMPPAAVFLIPHSRNRADSGGHACAARPPIGGARGTLQSTPCERYGDAAASGTTMPHPNQRRDEGRGANPAWQTIRISAPAASSIRPPA
jgi:hypothetical protein